MKELSYRNMTTSEVINKLKDFAGNVKYCEIEGCLCRAIVLLERYRDLYANGEMNETDI